MPHRKQQLADARSFLFVPGSRPDRFDKAMAAGADMVVLDLEDAVLPEDKTRALRSAVDWLDRGMNATVRVNARGTQWHDQEVAMLADMSCDLMVPKAEDAGALAKLGSRIGGNVVALVETARGVRDLDAVAAAAGVARIALGTIDLAAELGIDPESRAALAYTRGRAVVASAAAGLAAPIDGVTTRLADVDALIADTRAAREMGFTGKLCIHPQQVPVVHHQLRPSDEEITWAERVVETAGTGGVAVIEGAMIDPPVVARARAVLSRARRSRSPIATD